MIVPLILTDEKQEPETFVLFPTKRIKRPRFAQSLTNTSARKHSRALLQNAGDAQSSPLLN